MNTSQLQRWITQKFRLRHVELIAEVYECGSILKAAKRLNLTQPAVTKTVKNVETVLNLSLFERTNRGLHPTVYGEIFARHAKIVLAQLRHAAEEMENMRAGYGGRVSVGTLLAASVSLLPEAVTALKRERPTVTVTVAEGTYDLLIPSLMAGDLDIIVGRLPESGRSSRLVYEEFYVEPICLVTRGSHPLARLPEVELQALVDEPWILPSPGTALRQQVEKAFVDARLPLPGNIIESVSILTNRALLRKSDCIGVLPYHVAQDDVEHGLLAILPASLKSMETAVGAITRASISVAPATAALLDCLRARGKNLATSPR